MTIEFLEKDGKTVGKSFSSVKEMFDDIDKRLAARSWYEKFWDRFSYKAIDIFHPRYNWNRLKRLSQRIFRGWDDSELWSLDYTIAKKYLSYFKALSVQDEEYKNVVRSFNFILDDSVYIDYDEEDRKKIREQYEFWQKDCQAGLDFLAEQIISFSIEDKFILEFFKYVYPRLKRFSEKVHGCPAQFIDSTNENGETDEEFETAMKRWKAELELMKNSFGFIVDPCFDWNMSKASFNIGINSFFKNFQSLWD
jgi:hypothetical protein